MAIQVIILSKRRLYIYIVIGSATSLRICTILYRLMVCVSQRTLTMFVGVVALRGVDNGVPQLPQT